MSLLSIISPGSRGPESGRAGQLSQLPVGTQVAAQIAQKLEGNLLRLLTAFGPLTVQADAQTAARLPTSGTLHLSVAGNARGAVQFSVLPEDGTPPRAALPVLQAVALPAGGRAPVQSAATPQTAPQGQTAAPQPGAAAQPASAAPANAGPPVLRTDAPLTATVVEVARGGGEPPLQQLLTSSGPLKTDIPLPFPPGTRVVIALQSNGQEVRITPTALQPGAGAAQGEAAQNPYQAAVGRSAGDQLLPDKAVTLPVSQLKALPPNLPAAPAAEVDVDQARLAASQTQGSAAPLFQSLAAVAQARQAPSNTVATLAAQILGLRLDGTKKVTPDALRSAVRSSGVTHEAALARGQAGEAGSDLKTMLTRLVQGLRQEGVRSAGQTHGAGKPPPPQRGVMFEASSAQGLRDLAAGGLPRADDILRQAEEALSRLRLLQLSGAPDRTDHKADAPRREMQLEIPVQLYDGTSVLQLHVEADGRKAQAEDEQRRTWQVHFSLNLGDQGAVNARVNLRGGRIGVMVWAEDTELRRALRDNLTRLDASLKELGLDVASVECRKFPLPNRGSRPPGQLIDEIS